MQAALAGLMECPYNNLKVGFWGGEGVGFLGGEGGG